MCGLGESAVGILKRNAVYYARGYVYYVFVYIIVYAMSLTVGKNVTNLHADTAHTKHLTSKINVFVSCLLCSAATTGVSEVVESTGPIQ